MLQKIKLKITSSWFFSNPPWYLRPLQIFVKGDALVLLPFTILILSTIPISYKITLILIGIFLAVRNLGEMIYWLLQQFGEKTYRPYDFGLKYLDNNAIYIIYQLLAIVWTTIGTALIILTLS
jgi:hypothetical protein